MSHEGWSSSETWLVSLWLEEEANKATWQEKTKQVWEAATDNPESHSRSESACLELADDLEEALNAIIPTLENSLMAKLLDVAFQNINCAELADCMLSNMEGYSRYSEFTGATQPTETPATV